MINNHLLYENDPFLYYINHDVKKAWHIVAKWYLDDLYKLLEKNGIDIVLTMSPNEAITHLGNTFYTGYRRLYNINRFKIQQNIPDFDTESTDTQRKIWKQEVWPDIISCMIEVSYNLVEYLKYNYNSSFASDFLSLSGSVDLRTIYGMIYKNNDQPDNSSIESTEEYSDVEYDSEHSQ